MSGGQFPGDEQVYHQLDGYYQRGQPWAKRWPDPDTMCWHDRRCFVYERERGICAYCKAISVPFEIDHIFPRSKGGSNCVDNLTLACRPCNRAKGGRTLVEWRRRR